MPQPPIVNQVRYILIIFSVFLFSLTGISCAKKSGSSSSSSSTTNTTTSDNTTSTSSGLYIAVGTSGTLLTSSDGTSWDNRTSGTTNNLYGVTYGNSTFVTVGDNGTILTSSDNGTSWTNKRTSSVTTNNLYGVTYANSTFVTVGDNATILTSSDGTSWTNTSTKKRTLRYFSDADTNNLYGVTYGNGLFVTVGGNATIFTSSDGTTWTERDGLRSKWIDPQYFKGVTYRKGLFVLVGRNGRILNSPDGITWKQRKSGTKYNLVGITNGNGLFVGVGKNGQIVTSFDGNWWVKRTYVLPDWLNGVTYGNGTFVTVGDNGIMLTSSDGISWSKRTSVTTNSLGAVKFFPSLTDISCSKKDDSSSSSSDDEMPGTYQLATNDYANGVATDSSGNVYVTGGTKGGLDGNTSAGNTDLFVVKYNSSGTKQWTKQLGSSGRDSANGVATDSSGNVYVTGVTFGGLDCNTSAGDNDLFVVKYNSSGTKQWTKQLGSVSSDFANGVATDSSGNVYVAGGTYGGLDGNSNGNSDLFVVKYNSSGTRQWTKQLGTAEYDEARGVATDSSGNVYVAGGTKGNLNGNSNSGRTDAFVIKYNSSGTWQWTKQLGTWQTDLANGVTTDSAGNVYVTGLTYRHLDGNTSAGSADLFVVKYNSSGEKQWTKQLGTSSRDYARGVVTDSSGNVYVTGDTFQVTL